MNDVLTVKDVATVLRVHQSTIYRLLKRGALPAFRVGSDWRMRACDIAKWLDEAQGTVGKGLRDGGKPTATE
jgi:excisionase family DNA binding protein